MPQNRSSVKARKVTLPSGERLVADHDEPLHVLSIDPGTTTLGVGVIAIDPSTFTLTAVHAETITLPKLLRDYEDVVNVHGEKIAKLFALEKALLKLLWAWEPVMVVSEMPYMGRFPQAFAALVECLSSIRRTLYTYDPTMPLLGLEPSVVKKAVGVNGRSGDKELMKKAVFELTDLKVGESVDLSVLDEHSIDALAVGYVQCKQDFFIGD